MSKQVFLLLLCFPILLSCGTKSKKVDDVDLVVYNGNIYTVDEEFTMAEAMAVDNGRIIAIGNDKSIQRKYRGLQEVDLHGKSVFPGFIDGHCHFYGYGITLIRNIDLRGVPSFDEVVKKLVAHHQAHQSDWLVGFGWNETTWPKKEVPSNEVLNKVFPSIPVVLTRSDGHAVLANTTALRLAGIDGKAMFDGGEVVVVDGKVTGLLIDKAAELVRSMIPNVTLQDKIEALDKVQKECLTYGLTTVNDAGLDYPEIQLLDSLQEQSYLKIRVNSMLLPSKENIDNYLLRGPYTSDYFRVQCVKLYVDGSLDSRGALLLEPYSDEPNNYGLFLGGEDYLNRICQMAYRTGFQVATHCIGDSANRIMLNIYAKHLRGKNDRRWRIEHAQVVNPMDLSKFKEYSIIPSIQATHATSDYKWAQDRLGAERIKHAYVFQDLLNQNGWIINGTDFPVEGINPLSSFYAAVTRKNSVGLPKGGFFPEQALSRVEALKSITIWAAKGCFEDKTKGSLEKDKLADFVVMNFDFMDSSDEDILNAKPIAVFVGGELVEGDIEIRMNGK
ncbi:MAG: amidohydrolase [Bacteroidales bacterium]